MSESYLTSRLGFFLDLDETERGFIHGMERAPQRMARGDHVMSTGERTEQLYVLKWGWAVVRARATGDRQAILRVNLPGDVIGLAEIGNTDAPHDIVMQTDGVICPFPRTSLASVYETAPRLAALLTAISSAEQIILRELLFAVGRLPAEDRLVMFLLSLNDRLSLTGAGRNSRFHMPLSQADTGDVLGLTSVYVSRLLSRLREEGSIDVVDRHVRLIERERLEARVGYRPLATQIDTSWFPPAARS